MSGVQSGTRLERLEHLQAVARMQRAHARWAGDLALHDRLDALVTRITDAIHAEQRARPEVAAAVRRADTSVQQHLLDLGVTAHDVKTWAVQAGLIPAVVRGRVSGRLVDAYAHAHHHQEHTP